MPLGEDCEDCSGAAAAPFPLLHNYRVIVYWLGIAMSSIGIYPSTRRLLVTCSRHT